MARAAGIALEPWTQETQKDRLKRRLTLCLDYAKTKLHPQFAKNEATAYNSAGRAGDVALQGADSDESYDADTSAMTGVNYSMKNLRLIHAQMSANPPATIPRPATSDPDDRRRARAADSVMRYSLRQYNLQEKFDQCNLNCLVAGTGIMKTVWDSSKGEILGYRKGRVVMQGDISVRSIAPDKYFPDVDSETQEDTRYAFEEMTISYDEALHRWPERRELLESYLANRDGAHVRGSSVFTSRRDDPDEKFESITYFEYWERGLPSNAMLGRYATCLEDGTPLDEVGPSPFAFCPPPSAIELSAHRKTGRKIRKIPPTARLPYHMITDIDVPRRVWGRSVLEFVAPLQELLNSLDTAMLENVQAHGVARLILPDGWEMKGDSITSSPLDIIKTENKGGAVGDPKYIAPMQLPTSMSELRAQTKLGIDDMFGVNEAMFGQQSREQSGFSMQYATNQGNMIRRRLFNKYVLLVESVYKAILDLVRKHWRDERTVSVLGKEKAFEAIDLKGADIDGGYDLVVEYGTSLSLDPMTRRQEILSLQGLFKEAKVPARVILTMLKLGELDVVDDMIQMSDDRQREIFEEMFATGVYIAPGEYEDHENMLAYALRYRMSSEFKYRLDTDQGMVLRHIRERAMQAAKEKAPVDAPGQQPGPTPIPQTIGEAEPSVVTPPGAVTEPGALAG